MLWRGLLLRWYGYSGNDPLASVLKPGGTRVLRSGLALQLTENEQLSVNPHITRLLVAASRNHAALSLGVRFCVLKSTYTSPKRLPNPAFHSKLSIVLHWK